MMEQTGTDNSVLEPIENDAVRTVGQDAPFSAFITNLGKYNEGELVGKWVDFPTTPEEMADTLKEIGIDGKQYEECFITDYDDNVGGLHSLLGEYENLDELNYLAAQLDDLHPYDLEKLSAIIQYGDGISCAADVINMTEGHNMDAYDFMPDVSDDSDLGYYWIEESGTYNLKDMGNLVNYIDYEAFGRDIRFEEGGFFVDPRGYMRNNGDSIDELYSGVGGIPDEYRLSTFKNYDDRQQHDEKESLNVLIIRPGEEPEATEIKPGLATMQDIVGGHIQAVYPYDDPIALICNEEGKLEGLPLNRALYNEDGQMYDIIAGNMIICGMGEEDFASLSPEQMEKYSEQFRAPEKFVRLAGEFVAVKQPLKGEMEQAKDKGGPEL